MAIGGNASFIKRAATATTATTTSRINNMPGLSTATTTTSISTGSTVSATSATSTITSDNGTASSNAITTSSSTTSYSYSINILLGDENKYIIRYDEVEGEVFIIVGSIIAGILLLVMGMWLVLTVRARNNASNLQKEANFQYNTMIHDEKEKGSYETDFFSDDTDSSSDISERIIKQKTSRLSMCSTNMLNDTMFVSPTEVLQQQGQGLGLALSHNNASSPSIWCFDDYNTSNSMLVSGQIEQTMISPIRNATNRYSGEVVKHFRAPSMHLEDLLDDK